MRMVEWKDLLINPAEVQIIRFIPERFGYDLQCEPPQVDIFLKYSEVPIEVTADQDSFEELKRLIRAARGDR